MAFVFADRVKERSATVGTGTLTLLGADASFRTFLTAIGNTNETFYTIVHETDSTWEVGQGTVGAGTLSRDTVLASSNAGLLVNFLAGNKTVFATAAAQHFTNTLTTALHTAINHVGVPGVPAPETFDVVAHNAEDHTGLPGVPAAEAFDAASHGATDHTVGPFNLLDAPAHQGIDHTIAPFNLLDGTSLTDKQVFQGNGASAVARSPKDVEGLQGVLHTKGTRSSTTGTGGDEVLDIFNLPADTLATDGDAVEITAVYDTTNGFNDFKILFGATAIYNESPSIGIYMVRAIVTRRGASSQFAFSVDTDSNPTNTVTTPSETLSSAIAISAVGNDDGGGTRVHLDYFDVRAVKP